MSKKVQAAAFSSLEKELDQQPGSLKPSSEMITEEGMTILSGVQRFIELVNIDLESAAPSQSYYSSEFDPVGHLSVDVTVVK